MAGEMVIAGPRRAQCCITRTGYRGRSHRIESRRNQHDAFHHLSDCRRSKPVVTMSALLFDLHEAGGGHFSEVLARGLRGDVSDPRKFRRSQCAPIHQRMQHTDTRGVAGERSYLSKSGIV
jgi:hypothetical protein